MNRLFFAFCLLLSSGFLFAQSKKEIKTYKIKSTTATTTVYNAGKETASYKSEYKVFDKEGNTTLDVEYNADGTVRKKVATRFTGKMKTEEIVEEGLAEEDGKKKYKKTAWKYNSKGEKSEETEYDSSGNVLKRTTITYTAKGDRAIEEVYDGAGKLVRKTGYVYDSKGLRTEKKVTGPDNLLIRQVKYTYTY
ncbi:MAG TPA: hypothetical protein VI731_06635 [Bacteroidia bacterium]|nr:hypothetical protein [Bacteroidia bacterium]